jgi:hypothetical protein
MGVIRLCLLCVLLAIVTGVFSTSGRSAAAPDFGPNVRIFTPAMTVPEIKSAADAISAQQVDNEFGSQRYALLFMPGTYGSASSPLNLQVGYYTDVAGLGASPVDVTVNGTIDSYNRCIWFIWCHGLHNFWRSLSNMKINVSGKSGCRAGQFWAASQASPLRRLDVNGYLTLQDYCSGFWQNASGGFAADSRFGGSVYNGLQQTYFVRNSQISSWSSALWGQVFAGVTNAPATSFPSPAYTTLTTTPVSREKPFLYVDATGSFRVYVPDVRLASSGPSWLSGQTPGHSIPIEDFFIARPTDTAAAINTALAQGKNLIFTPGVYSVNETIHIDRPGTVVLGLGFATLDVPNGVVAMSVADVAGVSISGLIVDAGPVNSSSLLTVGEAGGGNPADPVALHDVFFRIGGPHVGKATQSLVVNSDHVILDGIWAWRADHGNGVGWSSNTADSGVVVNGDDVTAMGFAVEHYQKHNVVWNGDRGRTIFFQGELPYDPPSQAAYQHDGVLGYAAYKVADGVETHDAWGLGAWCYFNVNPSIHAAHAFEVPSRPGVRLHSLSTLSILNQGVIDHVVNDVGPPTNAWTAPITVTAYP